MATNREEHPLRWPDGWPRTRIQDRKPQASWKKGRLQALEALGAEMKRLGATDWIVTTNERSEQDPGVAIYFTRKPLNEFAWQEALGLIGEVPTLAAIDKAYRDRAQKCHPDRPGGDAKLFAALTEHRDRARDWATGRHRIEHEYVLACDQFSEVRLNITAIRLTVYALRQIERCGASVMMERAFQGFHKQITAGSGV